MTDVTVVEVGPRDGLQAVDAVMPTTDKLDWIRASYDAGIRVIQVGSFVPPARLPQLADTADVVTYAKTLPGLRVSALVPNLTGAQNALAAGVHHISVPVSVSVAHSLANVRTDPAGMIERVRQICALRDSHPAGQRPEVTAGLATAFGCTIQGEVPEADVEKLAVLALDAGADSLSIADTVGYANPAQVSKLVRRVRGRVGGRLDSAHFHDTRGMGLANVVAALEAGLVSFDACLAGLGGCPHSPGATGNIVTEDLVYLLESMGLRTGVDFGRLVAARDILRRALPGEPLQGYLWKAGAARTFRPARP